MKYHLEIIRIVSSNTKAFCRIYLYDNSTIKQIINLNIKNFTNLKSSVIETDNGFNFVLNENNLNIQEWNLDLHISSSRICTFKAMEITKQNSCRIIEGDICREFLHIIDLENRKLKDRII